MSTLDSSLRSAFLSATYGTRRERFRLAEAPGQSVSRASVPWAKAGQSWAVLTAWNPAGKQRAPEENLWRGERLRRDLTALGLPFFEGVNGEGEWAEPGYIVLGLSLREAASLGARYGQAAVLWGAGRRVALAWCAPLRLERRWAVLKG